MRPAAITQVAADLFLVNRAWVDTSIFGGVEFIDVDASEAYAANAVLVGDAIIYPSSFPRTQGRLASAGLRLLTVDADELAKAEGAVTCCSLIFEGQLASQLGLA